MSPAPPTALARRSVRGSVLLRRDVVSFDPPRAEALKKTSPLHFGGAPGLFQGYLPDPRPPVAARTWSERAESTGFTAS